MDGFGIYGFEDVNGEKPVTDECGGHFGPVDTGKWYLLRFIINPRHMQISCPELTNPKLLQQHHRSPLGEVVYHYHSRTDSPYHLACQGPSFGKCKDTQRGANFCAAGCGYDVCIQPGKIRQQLTELRDLHFEPRQYFLLVWTRESYAAVCCQHGSRTQRGAFVGAIPSVFSNSFFNHCCNTTTPQVLMKRSWGIIWGSGRPERISLINTSITLTTGVQLW